jgi:hypothetical protein
MKTKAIFSTLAAVALVVPVATAQSRGGGGRQMGGAAARGGPATARNMGTFRPNGFNRHFHDRDDFRHFHDRDFVFIDTFGFPFWGYPWGWGYPYPYPYGYYGYYPYGYGYYGDAGYGYGYGSDYRYTSRSRVAEMQRRLARAGYYHGSIDGIMGPQTRRAIRAYQRDRGAYG